MKVQKQMNFFFVIFKCFEMHLYIMLIVSINVMVIFNGKNELQFRQEQWSNIPSRTGPHSWQGYVCFTSIATMCEWVCN